MITMAEVKEGNHWSMPAACPPDHPLRVLFLADHLGHEGGGIHGVTTYLVETLPAFDRAHVIPSLVVLRRRHPAAMHFTAAGIPLHFFERSKWDPRALVDLARLMQHQVIDLLHICGLKSLLLGRLVARWQGCPVVAHFHDSIPAPWGLRLLDRRVAAPTEVALAVSGPIRDFVVRECAFPPDRARVLHNGLRYERFVQSTPGARERIRDELALAPSAPVIGLVGRVDPVKGQRLMIRALPQVLRQCPEALLLIVGEGPDRAPCAALADDLGLGGRVRFTGQRADIPDLLAAVDLVVVPSIWEEPFGFVALEAMAAGRPVVAFRTGGLPESIVDGRTGYLVPMGDEDALAAAVARVASQPALARRLGEAGARRAQEFSIQRHVAQLEALYQSIACRAVPVGARR